MAVIRKVTFSNNDSDEPTQKAVVRQKDLVQVTLPEPPPLIDTDHLSMADLQAARISISAKRKTVGDSPRSDFSKLYFNDPVSFTRECIRWNDGRHLAAYQEEILGEIPYRKRVAAYGPHGLGKTAIESLFILWFALTRDGLDWKVPTTASAWRQLTKFLWPEVRKWARLIRWERVFRGPFDDRTELLQLSLKLNTGEAFAVASDDATMIEGAHADNLAYSFDESKSIPPDIWNSAEGAFSTGDCIALACSTPGEPMGRFYDICSKKKGYEDWWVRHVTLEEAVKAGRISIAWAEQRRKQWGEKSAVYINRVLGEFASSDDTNLIPLSWVEQANDRWRDSMDLLLTDPYFSVGPLLTVGADVSNGGVDRTVLALRHQTFIEELRSTSREDTMVTTGRINGILTSADRKPYAVVDSIGVGAGVVARLRELGCKVYAFNASEKTSMRDSSGELGFINKRAAAWWHMRELLDPENGYDIALPPDDMLIGDLTAPHWTVTSQGRVQIESKDDIRELIEGRSTDFADAVVQAFWLDGKGGTAETATKAQRWNKLNIAGLPEEVIDDDETRNEFVVSSSHGSRWKDVGVIT